MHRKIISCILILLTLSSLVCMSACNKDNPVPDGMYSATLSGEPFTLYVPEGWTDNRDSGISSAYYSLNDAVTVSARYYAKPSDYASLQGFVIQCEEIYKNYPSFTPKVSASSKLGGKAGYKYEFTFVRKVDTMGGEQEAPVNVLQYFGESGDNVVILTFYSLASATDTYREAFEEIRSAFVLGEAAHTDTEIKTDKKTPDGMKIASSSQREYVFYVPADWACNTENKMSEAHYPSSTKPNVTVTSFTPDGDIDAREYFLQCEELYKKAENLSSYSRTDEPTERVVGGRNALSYIYSASYGEAKFKIMQTVFIYNGMAYSITYTALDSDFDTFMPAVESILSAFRFR